MTRRRWAVVPLLALTVGCAGLPGRSPRTPGGAPEDERRRLEAAIVELERQSAMAQAEIRLLRQRVAQLMIEVERLDAAAPPPTVAEPAPTAAAPPTFEESDLDVDPPVVPPPLEAPAAEVTPTRAPPSEAPLPVPMAGQSIYDRGYTLYHQGRYVDAEASFQRFLQAHGDTDLADNAQFWIGESRFARGDWLGARMAFQEVLDRYPDGNKTADALLKVGDCLVRLGDPGAARERFEEVIRRFPGSAASAMAEERLLRSSG